MTSSRASRCSGRTPSFFRRVIAPAAARRLSAACASKSTVPGAAGRVAQHAQAIAQRQHAGERSIDVGLVDQVPIQRVGERSVGAADLQVAAGAQRGRRRLGFIRHVAVSLVGIRDGECIAHHQPLETPGAAERVLQQLAVGAARHAVDGVVRRHDRGDPSLDAGLERRQVGLVQVLRRDRHVESVAEHLRAAVHGEVLGAGGDSGGGGIRSLQAADGGARHGAGQIRVLPEGLMAASPARVAEDVHVRGAEGEAPVALAAARQPVLVERLGGDRLVHLCDQLRVEGGRQGDRLREDGGDAGTRHAVQALAPPVVGGDVQPRDGRRLVHQESHLLLRPQGGDQVSYATARCHLPLSSRSRSASGGLVPGPSLSDSPVTRYRPWVQGIF